MRIPQTSPPRRLPVALLAATLAAIFIQGCGQPDPWQREDPVEAARLFLASLAYQDLKTAWEFLNDEDRAALQARADHLKRLAPNVDRAAPMLLHPGHIAASATEIKTAEVISRSDFTAEVRITLHDGRNFTLPMRRAQDRWTIDIPIPPAPPSETPR